jgi:hypothetical protein
MDFHRFSCVGGTEGLAADGGGWRRMAGYGTVVVPLNNLYLMLLACWRTESMVRCQDDVRMVMLLYKDGGWCGWWMVNGE